MVEHTNLEIDFMNEVWGGIVTILMAIVGVAILAVLVGNGSQTIGVIGAAAKGFAQDLSAAEAPVLGGSALGMGTLSGGASSVLNY
jgi:hypothetical protein